MKLDQAFLHSEEYKDIVIKTVENSVRTSIREKAKLNCRILVMYGNYTGGLYLITPLFQSLMKFTHEKLLGAPIKS